MKVRIQNDGNPKAYMTRITDAETGEEIQGVNRVELDIDASSEMVAKLTVYGPVLDVIVDAEIKQVCPVCGKPVVQE